MSYPEPRYTNGHGEVSAELRRAGAEPDLVNANGGGVHYLRTGANSEGLFGLYRWEMPATPSGPKPHFHRGYAESFYVLTGTVKLYDGETWIDAQPNDYLYVPPGGVHAFRNESGAPATMLILFAPGAPREAYFEELADIAKTGRQLSEEEWADLYARHDQINL
jgi:mannose-6-phosphate isomerase-like protein (cupin superfamily)